MMEGEIINLEKAFKTLEKAFKNDEIIVWFCRVLIIINLITMLSIRLALE
jgi:hypothetical protein